MSDLIDNSSYGFIDWSNCNTFGTPLYVQIFLIAFFVILVGIYFCIKDDKKEVVK